MKNPRTKIKKTDNSYFLGKVKLREKMIQNLDTVRVLDLYAGTGKIWKTIQKRNKDKKIIVTSVEKEKGKNPDAIEGDSLKIIPGLDLSVYDLIDLDVYGHPYYPLKAIVKNGSYKDNVIITMTDIQVGYGGIPLEILTKINFTKKQIKKIPTMFYKFELDAMLNYLYDLGVKKVILYRPVPNKKYMIHGLPKKGENHEHNL